MLLKEKSSLLVLRGGELCNGENKVDYVFTAITRLMGRGTLTTSFPLDAGVELRPIRT